MKDLNIDIKGRPALPRSEELRKRISGGSGGSSVVISGNSGTSSDPLSHRHANKADLDQITTDAQGYEYLTRTIEVENEEGIKEFQTVTEKVKAGYSDIAENAKQAEKAAYADVAHDLTEDSPVRDEFLSKIKPDTAERLITFLEGLEVGQYEAGASGGCFKMNSDGHSYAEVAKLYVRIKAFFEELTVIRARVLAGKQYITAGGGVKCTAVEETDLVYRCWFLTAQDGEKTDCKFIAGDQAVAQMFNAREGTANKVSNSRFWRLVVDVNNDAATDVSGNHYGYIDLSKTDCESGSDAPKEGDEICQLGYKYNDNPERQTAMIFSTVDSDSPCIKMYSGINSYSLAGKAIISFGRDPQTGKIFFRLGADNATQYLEYTQDRGLTVAGKIVSKSTLIGDGDDFRPLDEIISETVSDVDTLFIQTSSPTNPPELPTVNTVTGQITNLNGWSTTAPPWQNGMYMWQCTYTRYGDGGATFAGPTCIAGATGQQGPQGVPGDPGADGTTYYTWIRYANDAQGNGISNSPTGKAYIGFAYNKTTSVESNNPADYTWSEIKGEQGVPGPVGPDGKTYYTWIQYSDNANGTPMYQQPNANTKYIGIAVNKETATEGTNPADYTWSLFKGADGEGITITSQSVKYSTAHTATQPADSTFTLNDVPTLSTGQYLWSRTEVMYSNGQPTVSYAVSRIGADGTSVTITATSVTYAKTTANTQPADSAFTYTSIGAVGLGAGDYLWTKTEVTYSDGSQTKSYTVSRIGSDGADGLPGAPGENGKTTYVHYAYANSANGATGFSTTYFTGALYVGVCTDYNQADPTTYTSYEWARLKGEDGTAAKIVVVNADATAFVYSNDFTTLVGPTSINLSATLQGVTGYQWSYKTAGVSAFTNISGGTGSTLSVAATNTTYFPTGVRSCTFRCTSGGVYDEVTIVKVSSGSNGEDGASYSPNLLKKADIVLTSTARRIGDYYYDNVPEVGKKYTLTLCYQCGVDTPYILASHYGYDLYDVNYFSSKTKVIESRVFTVLDHASLPSFMAFYRQQTSGFTDDTTVFWAVLQEGDTGHQSQYVPAASEMLGQDAYTVLLTNESHIFEGDTEKAVAASTASQVIAYKGATQVAANIGTITGMPAGMTVATSNNGTTSAKFTVSVTTALTTKQGTLNVPVTVDGKTFTQVFSWSLSLKGKDGRGIAAVVEEYALSATTTAPADSAFGTAIPTMTDAQPYLWNREKTTYTDNTSATTAAVMIGVRGQNGAAGATVTSVTNYYLASSKASGVTTAASEGWVTDASATAATMTADKPYLWNYEVTKWSKGSDTSTTPHVVGKFGKDYPENLLLKSETIVNNNNYNIANYYLAEIPVVGEDYTFTLWGELAAAKTAFGIYNSGGSVYLTSPNKIADGVYSASFLWRNSSGATTVTPTHIKIYALDSTQSGTSSISRVKLEKGSNASPVWTPALSEMGGPTLTEEYYLSTSQTSLSGGSWQTTVPTWSAGKYIWTRTKIETPTGTVTYTAAVCTTGATGTSVLAEYSADGTNWHPVYDAGDIWMHTSNDGGVTWTSPIKIVGDAGADGQYWKFQWAKNTSTVEAPVNGWHDEPVTALAGEYVWMRSGIVIPPATTPAAGYGTAIRLTGDTGAAGKDTYRLDLSNEVAGVAFDSAGAVTGSLPTSSIKVYKGSTVDSGWTFAVSYSGCTASITNGILSINSLTADTATATVTATKSGAPTLQATMSVYKVKPGASYSPNLLLGSKTGYVLSGADYPNNTSYSSATNSEGFLEFTITTLIATTGLYRHLSIANMLAEYFQEGKTYTLSAEVKSNAAGYLSIDSRTVNHTNIKEIDCSFPNTNGQWQRVSGTLKMVGISGNTRAILALSFLNNSPVGSTATVRKICLTKGDSAAYVPAESEMVGTPGAPGTPGAAAVVYSIGLSVDNVTRNALGNLSSEYIDVTKYRTTGASPRTATTDKILKMQRMGIDTTEQVVSANGGVATTRIPIPANCSAFVFTLYDTNSAMLDRERVPIIQDAPVETENLARNSFHPTNGNTVTAGTDISIELSDALKKSSIYTFTIWGTLSGTVYFTPVPTSAINPIKVTPAKIGEVNGVSVYSATYSIGALPVAGATSKRWKIHVGNTDIDSSSANIDKFKVELGTNTQPFWTENHLDIKPLIQAMRESTTIDGGLVLTSLIQLGYTKKNGEYVTMSGINGVADPQDTLAVWTGGEMIDKAKKPTNAKAAKAAMRHNGTAYFCDNTVRMGPNAVEVGDNVVLGEGGLTMAVSTGEVLRIGDVNVETIANTRPSSNNTLNGKTVGGSFDFYIVNGNQCIPVDSGGLSTTNLNFNANVGMRLSGALSFSVSPNLTGIDNTSGFNLLLEILVAGEVVYTSSPILTTNNSGSTFTASGINITHIFTKEGAVTARLRSPYSAPIDASASQTATNATATFASGSSATFSSVNKTVLGGNGFLAIWGQSKVLMSQSGIELSCGHYGLLITQSGFKINRGNDIWANWAP